MDLGVAFTSDTRRNKEFESRIGKANAVLRELCRSVVAKREISKTEKQKLSEDPRCLRLRGCRSNAQPFNRGADTSPLSYRHPHHVVFPVPLELVTP